MPIKSVTPHNILPCCVCPSAQKAFSVIVGWIAVHESVHKHTH